MVLEEPSKSANCDSSNKTTALFILKSSVIEKSIFSVVWRVILGSILVVFYYIYNFVIRQPANEVLRSKSYKLCAS